MNRTLSLGLSATILVWLALLAYDTGSNNTLDQVIVISIVVLYLGVAVHMLVDRGWTIWTASAVGILLGSLGWVALFGRTLYTWLFGAMTAGEAQGWLDLVRALVIVGAPMLGFSLIAYRLEKRRTGEPSRPGELLVGAPTWPEIDRRSGVDRRRASADIYDRGTD